MGRLALLKSVCLNCKVIPFENQNLKLFNRMKQEHTHTHAECDSFNRSDFLELMVRIIIHIVSFMDRVGWIFHKVTCTRHSTIYEWIEREKEREKHLKSLSYCDSLFLAVHLQTSLPNYSIIDRLLFASVHSTFQLMFIGHLKWVFLCFLFLLTFSHFLCCMHNHMRAAQCECSSFKPVITMANGRVVSSQLI